MTPIVNYTIGVIVVMAAFYAFYLILLSNDTHYSRNRRFLLFSIIVSLILPALNINIGSGGGFATIQGNLSRIVSLGTVTVSNESTRDSGLFLNHPLLLIYLVGLTVSVAIVSANIIRILEMIKRGNIDGTRLVITDTNGVSGFSAFGYIFLSNKLEKQDIEKITEHEFKHINHKHFIDLVLIRIVSIIFWFNPFVYLFERSLKAIHEYQADNELLQNGENLIDYQKLLLNQLFQTRLFSVQSAFAGKSLIKKRIIMMTKQKTRKIAVLKLVLVIPVMAILAIMFSCSEDEGSVLSSDAAGDIEEIQIINKDPEMVFINEAIEEKGAEIFVVVEKMPTFNGGDVNKFRHWVQTNVTYPKIAVENGIQGKVHVMFVVETDGSVTNAIIQKGVDPVLDNEVLRTVLSSPTWVAGQQREKEVRVRFAITVNFKLQ